MLNHSKLLKELQKVSDKLFVDNSQDIQKIKKLWQQIIDDPIVQYKIKAIETAYPIPTWYSTLDDSVLIEKNSDSYRVVAIDGSQIYPDKHQGTNCFLINVGLVDISYGQSNPVVLQNEPYVFAQSDFDENMVFSTELVNCYRQEYELNQIIQYGTPLSPEQKNSNLLFLFDGSLIFWHLDAKEIQLKQIFLKKYLDALQQIANLQLPVAGYISLPKSKELVNIIRVALEYSLIANSESISCDQIVDTIIAHCFLQPYTRSGIFRNNTSISQQYPEHIRPYFFYLHVGYEIARIEVPAWIARDETLVNQIASIMIDQALKGQGYPIALAEAHEQAVVKGVDREFFYHLIYKIGFDYKQKFSLSQKSIKKRGIGI